MSQLAGRTVNAAINNGCLTPPAQRLTSLTCYLWCYSLLPHLFLHISLNQLDLQ